jgi:hypothetical protein
MHALRTLRYGFAANATCVNAAVNALVDRAGAAACRKQRQCPGDGSYPRDGSQRNCWVECFASTVIGSDHYPGTVSWDGAPRDGLSQGTLVQAFEAAFADARCAMPAAAAAAAAAAAPPQV